MKGRGANGRECIRYAAEYKDLNESPRAISSSAKAESTDARRGLPVASGKAVRIEAQPVAQSAGPRHHENRVH
jgi:hypothetical protein